MNQAQQQQFAQLLGQHDRTRRSTEMPLFYGSKEKDVCSALYLIDRLENSAKIANWDTDERKCEEFYAVLRDKALVWWFALKDHNVDPKVWAEVKQAFLKSYEPKYSPKLTFTNFSELVQKNNEAAHDFYLRLTETCRKMFAGRPAALADIRVDYPNAGAGAWDNAIVRAIKKEGLEDDEMYIKHQIFIAGLKDELRTKVIEANKPTLGESVYYAIELEAILNEKKIKLNMAPIAEIEKEELDEEEKNMINAFRSKKFGTGNGGKFQKRTPPKASASTVCRYCKKNGHFQRDCRSRIRDKAPMVDASGQPYKKVNQVTSEAPIQATEEWEAEPQAVGSIHEAQALNWY
jgi:hypothetical protein